MGEQILEDVALDVGAELAEVEAIQFVHDLLEDVGVRDLQDGVAEILGELRLFFDERGHVGEDLVADEVPQLLATLESPLRPPVPLGLLGEEQPAVPVAFAAGQPGAEFTIGFLFIQQLEVDEVGDLLDVGDRIGDAPGPEDIGDAVELSAKVLVHVLYTSRRCPIVTTVTSSLASSISYTTR
jgi:hypothetical protein